MLKPHNPLWVLSLIGLTVLLLLEFPAHGHAYFETADIWGFNAWFGFGMTAVLIVLARIVHAFIRRGEDYYD